MSGQTEPLAPLLAALRDLVAWFQAADVPGMIIGGVAASLLGRPRLTQDIDAIVLLDQGEWEEFLAAASEHGFRPRLQDPLVFARQSRVLLLRHEPSDIDADVSFGLLPFEEEAVSRAVWVAVTESVRVPVPTPEDLIVMKAVAHRPRDMSDIESILDVHPELDLERVRRSVREFSTALEAPEILSDLQALLGRRR